MNLYILWSNHHCQGTTHDVAVCQDVAIYHHDHTPAVKN